MPALEERGYFWWNNEPVPKGHLAPAASVAGLLKIDDDGRVDLELQGVLPSAHGPFAALNDQGKALDRHIQGLLNASGRRALLIEVIPNGGELRSNAISSQNFLAINCLVGETTFAAGNDPLTARSLEVGLSGFGGWLRVRSIKISRSKDRVSAEYTKPEPAVYKTEDGTLTFNFNITGRSPVGDQSDNFSMKEEATLVYALDKITNLEGLRQRYGLLEDLFILLTDSHYRLDWPFIHFDTDTKLRWYFQRMTTDVSAPAPNWHECWTSFPQVREAFGNIWSNWKRKREQFGPGFYLYLGTRRGTSLYTEHRFVNLVWGIEAFHRTKHAAVASDVLKEKITRIVGDVSLPKDKTWLRKKLKYAHEPALADRISEAFKDLPLDLDSERLRHFSKACADARNDISHFGGHRRGGSYTDFARNLEKMSGALSTLYHCLLLAEIGVDREMLKWWVYEGYQSYRLKWYFVEVGLLPEEALKPLNVSGGKSAGLGAPASNEGTTHKPPHS